MAKQLSNEQKERIKELLISDEALPADLTIGDRIKEHLELDDAEYGELEEEISTFVEEFFNQLA